jgi:starch synthase (maltosyl-transferring)
MTSIVLPALHDEPVSAPTPIALCITDLDPGGAERALVQIVTRLDRTVWTPTVYCLSRRGELVDVLEAAGIETHSLNAEPRDVTVVWRLARLLLEQPPALLQTFLFHANLAGRLAAARAGVPIVVSGIRVAEREKAWHLRLERWTKRFVTHHVCVSQAVADFAERELRLPPGQVSVIANGVDAKYYADATPADLGTFGIPPGAPTLLFVGRLHRQKGVFDLLSAMEHLEAVEERNVHLLMVGDGPLRVEAEEFTDCSLIQSRVHWLGKRDDVASLMKASTALVLPSLWEGMPNVVLEAMAAGLPVLATGVDGTRELVTHNVTGRLCLPGNPDSLAMALRDLLTSPASTSEMAARAQRTVTKHFTWNAAAAGYDRLWRRLLAEQG